MLKLNRPELMWKVIKTKLSQYAVWDDQISLNLLSRWLFSPLSQKAPQRILVHRTGRIGEFTVAIPALVLLRKTFPQAQITLLTPTDTENFSYAAEVLSAFPKLMDEIITYSPAETKSLTQLKQLKNQLLEAGSIDLWVSLPVTLQTFSNSFQELLFARWLKCQSVLGMTVLLPDMFQTLYARRHPDQLFKASDWLFSMIQNGLGTSGHPQDCLDHFQPSDQWIASIKNLDLNLPLLAVNAGAKNPTKRWPQAYFQKTLQQIQIQFPQLQIVLLGSPEESSWNEEIRAALPETALNLCGQLNLSETWGLLNRATAVLANDTSVLHMAGLLGKPTFAPLSGQYLAPLCHPPGQAFIEFQRPVPCAPCFKNMCPLNEQICLTLLTPEWVYPSIIRQLSQLLS
jgi:ADP-heptose:LPS heptosyltransferase